MTELYLVSANEGPDVSIGAEQANFESLLADEVVVEWLRNLEQEARTTAVN